MIADAELDALMAGSGDPVARVELYHFAAELPATFRPAWIPGLPQQDNRCTLVRVVTRDGVEGWSAGPALGRERAGLGDLLGPYMVGEDATDVHVVQQRLREMSDLGWRNWWIEPAFWDIKAQRAGVPLHRLLDSAAPTHLACYASTGELRTPRQRIADDELGTLTAESPVPIAGGELDPSGYPELAMMVDRGCYDLFQPDAVFTGGVAQTVRVINRARAAGLAYTPHTWTNGVGLAINLHLHAASGFGETRLLEYPYDPPGWTPEARDAMLAEPLIAEDGRLPVPHQPGLGVAIDRRALRRHGDRYFVMDRKRLAWFGVRDRGLRAAREIDRAKRARRQQG